MSRMGEYALDMQDKKNEELDLTYKEMQALDRYFEEMKTQDYRAFITSKPKEQVKTRKMEQSIFTRFGNWYDRQ